jgi:hypothetical protein
MNTQGVVSFMVQSLPPIGTKASRCCGFFVPKGSPHMISKARVIVLLAFICGSLQACTDLKPLQADIDGLKSQVTSLQSAVAAAKQSADSAGSTAQSASQAANSAQSAANQALAAAQASQSCCDSTNEKIDRMFKRSVSK